MFTTQTLFPLQTHNAHLHIKYSMEAGSMFGLKPPVPHPEEACLRYMPSGRTAAHPLPRHRISLARSESWPPFKSQLPAIEHVTLPGSPPDLRPGSTRPESDLESVSPGPSCPSTCRHPALLILSPQRVKKAKCLEQPPAQGKHRDRVNSIHAPK